MVTCLAYKRVYSGEREIVIMTVAYLKYYDYLII
jgi:hypothetical protein